MQWCLFINEEAFHLNSLLLLRSKLKEDNGVSILCLYFPDLRINIKLHLINIFNSRLNCFDNFKRSLLNQILNFCILWAVLLFFHHQKVLMLLWCRRWLDLKGLDVWWSLAWCANYFYGFRILDGQMLLELLVLWSILYWPLN